MSTPTTAMPSSTTWAHAARARHRRRMAARDDSGVTLVELMMAFMTFLILATVVTVSLDVFLSTGDQVQTSYANTNQILPVGTSLQRLVRSEVEIAPAPTTAPTTASIPFPTGAGLQTGYQTTFYANVGIGVGGSQPQPAKVVAMLSGTTFTVTDQLADAGSCPILVSSTTHCTFNNNKAKQVAYLNNVVNLNYPTGSSTPVFTYTLLDTTGGGAGTQSTVTNTNVFLTCNSTAPAITNCPGDAVQGLEINLWIKSPGSKALTPTEDDTIVYRLSSNSYLYSQTVG